MKSQVLREKILFLVLVAISFFTCVRTYALAYAQTTAPAQAPAYASAHEVTAGEYAGFLNHTATSNVIPAGIQDTVELNLVYDEHMATDPGAAYILRLGTPGKYSYQVIAGRENFPVSYVNFFDEEKYCNETGLSLHSSPSHIICYGVATADGDPSLRSNRSTFTVNSSSSPMLALASIPISYLPSSRSYFKDGIDIAAVITSVAFCGGLIGLQEFREAAVHPGNEGVQRLIVSGSGDSARIMASDAEGANSSRIRSDNNYTAENLQTALESEHPADVAKKIINEHLPKQGTWIKSRPSLSTEGLQRILARADAERDQRIADQGSTLLHHKIASGSETLHKIKIKEESIMIEMTDFNKAKEAAAKFLLPELTHKAFQIFLEKECLEKGKYIPCENKELTAIIEHYFQYVETAIDDLSGSSPAITICQRLAAIDRAEQAWRLKILAINANNVGISNFFNEAYEWMYNAALSYNSSLGATRLGYKEIAALWTQAARQYESDVIRKAVALRYRAEQMQPSGLVNADGVILKSFYPETISRAAYEANQVARDFSNIAICMHQRAEAAAQGNQEIADLFTQAIEEYKAALRCRTRTQTDVINTAKRIYYGDGTREDKTASHFAEAARCMTNAGKASAQGNQEVAALWTKAANQYENLAEEKFIYPAGNLLSPWYYSFFASPLLKTAADNFVKAANALDRGDQNDANDFIRVANKAFSEALAGPPMEYSMDGF